VFGTTPIDPPRPSEAQREATQLGDRLANFGKDRLRKTTWGQATQIKGTLRDTPPN